MRLFRALAAAAAAFCVFASATAADFSGKTLTLVVPFAAGGVADLLARAIGAELQPRFPGGIVVENKTGAGGNIGAEQVFRSAPDGYTLLVSSPGPIAVNQGLYPKLPYDPGRWVAVGMIASVPNALIVGPSLPAATASGFIAYVKANPGRVSYASQGNGTTSHLTAKLFESLTGTSMIHVPYKGDAPALNDLAGGQVDAFFGSIGASLALHRAGRVRILAVADDKRSPALPELPSFAELGLPAMRSVTWYAVVAPPDTPPGVVWQLNGALNEALARPDMQQRFANLGLAPMPMPAAEAGQFIRQETARWQNVIRDAKVTIE
jgi:tripartite-type tricarboxylate transporter receptor subunit TctC